MYQPEDYVASMTGRVDVIVENNNYRAVGAARGVPYEDTVGSAAGVAWLLTGR